MGFNLSVSIWGAFIGGLFSFFSPCIIPLLPVYVSILTETGGPQKANSGANRVLNSLLFVLGVGASFAVLGFGFGTVSAFVSQRAVSVAAGLLIVLMGVSQMGLIHLPVFDRFSDQSGKIEARGGPFRSFLLGLLMSIGWIPCIGPILASILFLSGTSGSALQGGGYMLIYITGFAVPFLIITIFSDYFLTKIRKIHPYLPLIKKIGGALLILIGLTQAFNVRIG
ncbi:hypothetical protein BEQ56_00970 [Anaerolineaceae bacterium oral taxon 439]|nr:hypothetical protein BEQ56_00970 [Anaerolineaceae bacterium oral taxon 439]